MDESPYRRSNTVSSHKYGESNRLNALKILSMRLRGAKAELQTAGEETDGMCESTAKLREKILALTGSVDIMADEAGTQFKSTYQIMQEIAGVWNDLTDINQAALLETIAGKLRGNSISALLTNMAQADKVLETSLNSAGSALTEHERWLESIAAKEAEMKAAWQDFADTVINTDAVKAWYDGLTGILNVLTAIIDKVGILPTLLGGVATFLSAKGNWLGTARDSAGNVVGRIGNYTMGSGGFSIFKMLNGEVNNDVINQYTAALNNGATAAEAMKQAVMDASGQVINLNGATRQALASQQGAAVAMQQFGISTSATTGKLIAQRAAVMALNVALNVGVMILTTAIASGVTALIQGIGTAIDKAKNPVKYLKEEYESLKNDYSDISSQVNEVNDELDTTSERIDYLRNKGPLTFVEKEELANLEKANEQYTTQKKLLEELGEIKGREIRNNLIEQYKADMQTVGTVTKSWAAKAWNTISAIDSVLFPFLSEQDESVKNSFPQQFSSEIDDVLRQAEELSKLMEQGFDDYLSLESAANLAKIKYEQANSDNIDELKAEYDQAINKLELGKAYQEYRQKVLETANTIREEYMNKYLLSGGSVNDDIYKEWQTLLDTFERTLYPNEFKSQKLSELLGLDEYADAITSIKQLANEGKLNESSIASYEKLSEALSEIGISAEEAVEYFNALAKAEQVAAESAVSFANVSENVKAIIDSQSKLSDIIKDQGYSASITSDQYDKLLEMGQDYADCVENVNGFMALNIEKINELVQAKYEEQKVEAAVGKAQAMTQYKQNIDEISLLKTELLLLADGEDELANSIQGQINALQMQNGSLLDEISGYERLASQLEYATSAYKKWLDAQNAPEAGDAYDNLFKAMGQIKEGQENGKIGTTKYKAAVELLVPDGREVSNYMQTLERYLTEDSSGLQNFIDDMYKRANPFLSKDSSGRYSFLQGVTVEDIAKGLGLTDEVAQYMLTALKDYGWDISLFDNNYKDSELLKNYDAAVVKLEEAQERLAELRKDTATSAEELASQEKAVAEAQQEVDNAAVAAGLQEEKSAIEQLKDELAELQTAYDTLKEFKLTGDIDPNFTEYLNAIQGVINLLNSMPEEGYTLNITNGTELSSAKEQIEAIEKAISSLNGMAKDGVISYELAATVNDSLSEKLTALQAEIDAYNEKTLEPKSTDITVGIKDNATDAIKKITDTPYNAIIGVQINPDDEAEIDQKVAQWTDALSSQKKIDTSDYSQTSEPQTSTKEQAPDNLLLGLLSKAADSLFGTNFSGGLAYHDKTQESDRDKSTPTFKTFKPEEYGFKPYAEQLQGQTQDAVENGVEAGLSSGLAQNKDESIWQVPPINLDVNTAEAEKAMGEMATEAERVTKKYYEYDSGGEAVRALKEELDATNGNIDQAISNLGTSLEKVKMDYQSFMEEFGIEVSPEINDEDFRRKLKELYELSSGSANIHVGANTSDAVRVANNAKTQIGNMKATIAVTAKYSAPANLKGQTLTLMARGTHYAEEEDAIVGEAGVETWIHDGRFVTVGQDGAELVHLSRGDQVLNAEETKKLFGNKQYSGNAYAAGLLNNQIAYVSLADGDASAIIVGRTKPALPPAKTTTTSIGGGNDLGGNKNTTTSSGGGSGSSDTNKEKDYLESLDDLVDWIPTAIENLKKKTDEYIDYADKAVGYILKNSNLESAITNISDEINLNLQAYDRYMQQANEIAQRMNLSSDIVRKIQDGTIDIQSYDEDTRKVISAYQKWYDLAIDCRDAVADLRDQQYELAKQKLDNITKYYENRITLLGTIFDSYQKQIDKKIASGKEVVKGDYSDMITNTQEQIDMLQQERDALTDELNALVDAGMIKTGSDEWYEYTNQIKEFDNTISDAQISIEEFKDSANSIVLTNMQNAMAMLEHVHSTIQGLMDLRSSQGKTAKASDYRDLISSGSEQIHNLEIQNTILREQQQGLDILSEKYQEIQKQINENEEAILSTKAKQEEWNDAIIDLEIDRLQKENTQYKSQLELMDAIENLQKAKQRRALVYREGRGFDYEANPDDVRSAQEKLNDLVFEKTIDMLEKSKENDNLYDDFGNELTPLMDTLPSLNLSPYYNSIINGDEKSGVLADILGSLDIPQLTTGSRELSVTFEEGSISLSGVNDVETLAEAIANQLPNAVLQEIYK